MEEQLLWAQQSDKKASEFMSNVHMRSGQALNKAGQPLLPAASPTVHTYMALAGFGTAQALHQLL